MRGRAHKKSARICKDNRPPPHRKRLAPGKKRGAAARGLVAVAPRRRPPAAARSLAAPSQEGLARACPLPLPLSLLQLQVSQKALSPPLPTPSVCEEATKQRERENQTEPLSSGEQHPFKARPRPSIGAACGRRDRPMTRDGPRACLGPLGRETPGPLAERERQSRGGREEEEEGAAAPRRPLSLCLSFLSRRPLAPAARTMWPRAARRAPDRRATRAKRSIDRSIASAVGVLSPSAFFRPREATGGFAPASRCFWSRAPSPLPPHLDTPRWY